MWRAPQVPITKSKNHSYSFFLFVLYMLTPAHPLSNIGGSLAVKISKIVSEYL